jgi:cystathionine gamma-synthase
LKPPLSAETLAAQALGEIDPESRALVPPIHPSTTYESRRHLSIGARVHQG